MSNLLFESTAIPPDLPPSRTIVRLRTTVWADARGLHVKKSLTTLRRKSQGYDILMEDVHAAGADNVLQTIINLDECDDGVYELVMCNIHRDWEMGYVDGYNLRLTPCVV